MPEIASAWVTLVASTKGMERDIRKAFDAANRNAKLDPKVDAGNVGQQGANAGKSFGSRFSGHGRPGPPRKTTALNPADARLVARATALVAGALLDKIDGY